MATLNMTPGLPLPNLPGSGYRPRTWAGKLAEDLRTGGADPKYRRAMVWSCLLHFFVIIVLPWLLSLGWGIEKYLLPKGSGVVNPMGVTPPKQVPVRIKKVVKKPKVKFILRTNTSIRFDMPTLDDSEQLKEVAKLTELEYKADATLAHQLVNQANDSMNSKGAPNETGGGLQKGGTGNMYGRLGKGGGTKGGYPEGSENSRIRFVRLNHGGRDWADNMNPRDRSDLNILQEFYKASDGIFKVETSKFEGYSMAQINAVEKGYKPPFIYMTGTGSINLSAAEVKMAQAYIAEGGLIFGDCGSPEFNSHFRAFANSLVPGSPLIEIADDDPIFSVPFILPNGAPPLWHHGGTKCMGVKVKGRWVVFYHPGDLKDAFRSPDHSGLDSSVYLSASRLVVNVIAYSFDHYLEESKKYRK
ncbi:MAG: DUF4159 domain-containing protein [Planctomycetota bacterium]|nr:DUF4159 domain-containing protein [Planctomycetota bacterium]